MRKLNYILLLCFLLLTAVGYGKIIEKESAVGAPLQQLEIQSTNNLPAADVFGNSLIPPLFALLILPG